MDILSTLILLAGRYSFGAILLLIRGAKTNNALLIALSVSLILASSLPVVARAEAKFLMPIHESQSLIIENNNLSAADFYSAYISKNTAERRYAEMYLLGVIDSSEGVDWCDYKSVKTITIDEAIFTGFKKLDTDATKTRASTIIKKILSIKFRCKEHK